MKKLVLPLKKEWYDMIASGVKPEEYRVIKWYWFRRLFYYGDLESWSMVNAMMTAFTHGQDIEEWKHEFHISPRVNQKATNDYTHVEFTLGYPKKDDNERRMLFELNGIEIRQGRTEWGAPEGKNVFVLKLGRRV